MIAKPFIVVSRYGSDLYTPERWFIVEAKRETAKRYYEFVTPPSRFNNPYWDKEHVHGQFGTLAEAKAFTLAVRAWWDEQQPEIDVLDDAYIAARTLFHAALRTRFDGVRARIAEAKA